MGYTTPPPFNSWSNKPNIKKKVTYSTTKPFIRTADLPWLTDDQFTQVWDAVLNTLSHKDIITDSALLSRWRRDMAQHWQGYGPFELPRMPLCPVTPTGNSRAWVAEEALRPNFFSLDELNRLNQAINVILRDLLRRF